MKAIAAFFKCGYRTYFYIALFFFFSPRLDGLNKYQYLFLCNGGNSRSRHHRLARLQWLPKNLKQKHIDYQKLIKFKKKNIKRSWAMVPQLWKLIWQQRGLFCKSLGLKIFIQMGNVTADRSNMMQMHMDKPALLHQE